LDKLSFPGKFRDKANEAQAGRRVT